MKLVHAKGKWWIVGENPKTAKCATVKVGDRVRRINTVGYASVESVTPRGTVWSIVPTGKPDPEFEGKEGVVSAIMGPWKDSPPRIVVDYDDIQKYAVVAERVWGKIEESTSGQSTGIDYYSQAESCGLELLKSGPAKNPVRRRPTLKELWEHGYSIAQMERRLHIKIDARHVDLPNIHRWFMSGDADREVFGHTPAKNPSTHSIAGPGVHETVYPRSNPVIDPAVFWQEYEIALRKQVLSNWGKRNRYDWSMMDIRRIDVPRRVKAATERRRAKVMNGGPTDFSFTGTFKRTAQKFGFANATDIYRALKTAHNPVTPCPSDARMCFTIHKGKTYLTSEKQHAFLHARHFDHTHIEKGGARVRHRWDGGKFVRQVQ